MTRNQFKLYDVVDTEGPTKGFRNNSCPLDLDDARKLLAEVTHGKPKVVPTSNKDWEDNVFRYRFGKTRKV